MEEELKKKLTPEQYEVLVNKGTERPFSGKYHKTKDKGMYKCAGCGSQLFSSDTKFDSGTGWPSFDKALPDAVEYNEDTSHGMTRTEVVCSNCGGHLGHVFDVPSTSSGQAVFRQDGKTVTRRYCINSCALDLKKQDIEDY